MKKRMSALATVGAIIMGIGMASPVAAHEQRKSGDHTFVVGWAEEPTFVGYPNGVSFAVSHGDEPAGGEFQVEVIFGDEDSEERTEPLALEPVFDSPGEYEASLIPTRSGTFTFHIFGNLEDGDEVDETFTSGEDTFDDPQDPAEIQFPEQDPTTGELTERLERLDARIASLQQSLGEEPESEGADPLAIAGLVLGALALIGVVILWSRKGSA